jgi:tetratricopeptide (TPR) repeat protein
MSRRAKGKPSRKPGPADSAPGISQGGPTSRPEAPPRDRWLNLAVCLFLALAVWIVFGQTRHHGFVNYDDNVYVYENPAITNGLTLHGAAWAFTHRQDVNWHPLTTLSHMLDCQLYGLQPAGHHLTSVLIHAATAILLFLMMRKLTGTFWPGAYVAALFAVHPLRVESVAWVAERKDVLSGAFFMLTLWAYARYARQPKTGNYLLTLFFFACGLMSKPMLVTLPFVLLLLDYWPLKRITFPLHTSHFRLLVEKVPFLALSAAACMVTVLAQKEAIELIQDLPFPWRIGNALVAYTDYIGQMFWPAGLAVLYPHPGNHLPGWKIALSGLVLLMITAGALAGWRRRPYLLVGWLWYLGMLVPVIGLMQVGSQARADRYTYLPQIGLYIMVAWGVAELSVSWKCRRLILGSAGAAIAAGLMAVACVQTGYWKDSITLWTHTLACTSGNAVAHNNLGIALADQKKFPEAVQQYQQAFQLYPAYAEAHYNLGITLAKQDRLPEAVHEYESTLQIDPNYAQAHINLGNALKTQGKLAEAIQHYQQALRLKPDYAEACLDLGNALATLGNPDEAIQQYERALQINPGYAEAHFDFGNALASQKRFTEAIQHYRQALQINPDYAKARLNLGNALLREEKLEEAIQQYEQVLQLKPDFAEAHFSLGNALKIQGKSAEAAQHFQQALDLATTQNNPALAQTIRARLQQLQAGGK